MSVLLPLVLFNLVYFRHNYRARWWRYSVLLISACIMLTLPTLLTFSVGLCLWILGVQPRATAIKMIAPISVGTFCALIFYLPHLRETIIPSSGTTSDPPLVYAEPSLAALPDTLRSQFDSLTRTLLDAVVGFPADERTEAEFDLAGRTFLRQHSPRPGGEGPGVRAASFDTQDKCGYS